MSDDFAEIYWHGAYPHNKIGSGINRLLKRRGRAERIAFDRKAIERQIEAIGRTFFFNDTVQVELEHAARQLAAPGLTLTAAHRLEPLNGHLHLHIGPADDPAPAALKAQGCLVARVPEDTAVLHSIFVRGFASYQFTRQADAFSATLGMDYVDVDAGLAAGTLDLTPFQRRLPSGPAWLADALPTAEGGCTLTVGTTTGQAFALRLRAIDLDYLTGVVAPGVALARSVGTLELVMLTLHTRQTALQRLLMPTPQALELVALAASLKPA